jgi:hypothetical protein
VEAGEAVILAIVCIVVFSAGMGLLGFGLGLTSGQ